MNYNQIKIYGNCDINYVKCNKGIIEDIDELTAKGIHTPYWDKDTIMLADFTGDINGDNYNVDGNIARYRVQVINPMTKTLKTVAEVDKYTKIIKDYNVGSNMPYQYIITPVFYEENIVSYGAAIKTDTIFSDWDCFSVIGLKELEDENCYTIDKDNVWNFGLNCESGDFAPQYNKLYSDGYGKYSKVSAGDRNYLRGSFKCLLGEISCGNHDYAKDDIYMITKWRNFCATPVLKLIRDSKGHIIIGDIEDTTYNVDSALLGEPTTISFNWRELANSNDCTIYEQEEE